MGIRVSEIHEALIVAGAPKDKARAASEWLVVSGWRLEETCRPAVDKVRPIPRHTLSKSHGGKVRRTALS